MPAIYGLQTSQAATDMLERCPGYPHHEEAHFRTVCKAPGTKSIWEAWKLLTAWHDCGSTDIRPCPGMLVEVVLCGRAQLQIWDNIPRCHVLPCHRIEAPHLHTTHHHGPGLHASHVPVGRAL